MSQPQTGTDVWLRPSCDCGFRAHVPGPAPHPGLSQKRATLGGGIAQSALAVQGSPRLPDPPPVLALVLTLLLDAATLLLDALAPPPESPAPPLLDAVVALLVLDPTELLLDWPPPLPDPPELAPDDEAPPLPDDVAAPVVEGPLSPHPTANAALPVMTETRARHAATAGPRSMAAIVPPSPDRPPRT